MGIALEYLCTPGEEKGVGGDGQAAAECMLGCVNPPLRGLADSIMMNRLSPQRRPPPPLRPTLKCFTTALQRLILRYELAL